MKKNSKCKMMGAIGRIRSYFRVRKLYDKQNPGMRIKCPECGSVVTITEITNSKCRKMSV